MMGCWSPNPPKQVFFFFKFHFYYSSAMKLNVILDQIEEIELLTMENLHEWNWLRIHKWGF